MKFENVADQLRSLIVRGEFSPGAQLPLREDLERQFDASRATVQQAVTALQEEGFLLSRGRLGTFVSERPPHLYRFGLVDTTAADFEIPDTLMPSFEAAALELESASDLQFRRYPEVRPENREAAESVQLLADVQASRLAGIVMPRLMHESFLAPCRAAGMPMVALMSDIDAPGVSAVWTDYSSFLDKALGRLRERGCTRIAMLANTYLHPDYVQYFEDRAAELALTTHSRWIQGICLEPTCIAWTARAVELLFHGSAGHRPDGLIIANENLAPRCLSTLQDLGIAPGCDVDVVTHVNYPIQTAIPSGVMCVGFDTRELLNACISNLMSIRKGADPEFVTNVAAVEGRGRTAPKAPTPEFLSSGAML